MTRKTLDSAVPMVYGLLVVVLYLTVKASIATLITVIGAILVGMYFAIVRNNLPSGRDGTPPA